MQSTSGQFRQQSLRFESPESDLKNEFLILPNGLRETSHAPNGHVDDGHSMFVRQKTVEDERRLGRDHIFRDILEHNWHGIEGRLQKKRSKTE